MSRETIIALSTTSARRLHKSDDYHVQSYITVLKQHKPLDYTDSNLYLYAYPRILDYKTCITTLYNKNALNARIMPYLPTLVMTLNLPIDYLLYYSAPQCHDYDAGMELFGPMDDFIVNPANGKETLEYWLQHCKHYGLKAEYNYLLSKM